MERQHEIDFANLEHRGTQRRLVEAVQFEKPPAGQASLQASPAACKAVLRVIDDYGRGRTAWPSIDTISKAANVSTRTAKRAIARLQAAGLLAVTKRYAPSGMVQNVYAVVWSELALLIQRLPSTSAPREALADPMASPGEGGSRDEKPGGARGHHGPTVSASEGPPWPHGPQERGASLSERGASLSERGASLSERGASLSERGATMAPNSLRVLRRPEPPLTAREAAAEVGNETGGDSVAVYAVRELLRLAGVEFWNSAGQRAVDQGWTPADVAQAVKTMDANRTRFNNPPAALLSFLQKRAWPVAGIVPYSAERSAAAARGGALKEARQLRDRILYQSRGRPEEQREAAVQQALPAEILAAIGGVWG